MTPYATRRIAYEGFGGHIIHEIYDSHDSFKHRLVAHVPGMPIKEGEWVSYQTFARLNFKCPKCAASHVFMATQDNWQPLFPPIFELRIPEGGNVEPSMREVFAQFLSLGE